MTSCYTNFPYNGFPCDSVDNVGKSQQILSCSAMSTSKPNSPIILPVITIDPTFSTAIQDVDNGVVPSELFWMSCYRASEPSIHAKIQVELDEVDRSLVHLKPREGDVEIDRMPVRNGVVVSPRYCSLFGYLSMPMLTYLYNRSVWPPVNHCLYYQLHW